MLGTIPADLMQYYVHALRIMQKLAYLYGWRDLLADGRRGDDETIGVLAVFFGVMLGVGGAAQSLTAFARIAAKTAYQKHVTKRALMSITWYPVVKYSLRVIGINITKSTFTKGVSKIVPVIGGFVSSGLTFMALQTQSSRLKGHLREIPPPGIDAEALGAASHRRGSAREQTGCDGRTSGNHERQGEGRDGRREERGVGYRRRSHAPSPVASRDASAGASNAHRRGRGRDRAHPAVRKPRPRVPCLTRHCFTSSRARGRGNLPPYAGE